MPRFGKITFVAVPLMVLGSALFVSAQENKKIYAQKLLDETLARHKDVVIMAMHVTPPGKAENVINASNIGRLGKKADEDDLEVIKTGKPDLRDRQEGRSLRSRTGDAGSIRKNHWCRRDRIQLRKGQRSRVPKKGRTNPRRDEAENSDPREAV